MEKVNVWHVSTHYDWDEVGDFHDYHKFYSHKEASAFYRYQRRQDDVDDVEMWRTKECITDNPVTEDGEAEFGKSSSTAWVDEEDYEIDFPF